MVNLKRGARVLAATLQEDWRRTAAVATCAMVGVCFLIFTDARDWIYHASYDWLLTIYPARASEVRDILIVACDAASQQHLSRDPIESKDRAAFAELTTRLFQQEARAVVFDVLLDQPGNGDNQFAQAITNGRTLLVRKTESSSGNGPKILTVDLPVDPIYTAASGHIASAEFSPDRDRCIRRHPLGTNSVSHHLAQMLKLDPPPAFTQRWLRYYGKPEAIPRKSYYQLLDPNFPGELVAGKIIFIGRGGTPLSAYGPQQSDRYLTPYGVDADGVEIHATATRNWLHREWISEPSPGTEVIVILAWGAFFSILLVTKGGRAQFHQGPGQISFARTLRRYLWLIGWSLISIGVLASFLFWQAGLWLPWTIPILVQMPTAAAWAVWIAFVPRKPRYDVFISYRRRGGAAFVRLVQEKLYQDHGVKAFVDVDGLGSGEFGPELRRQIETIPSFVFIVSDGAFGRCHEDTDWVREEIKLALNTNRNIIPFLMEGCEMPKREALPSDIANFATLNALPYSHAFSDAAIAKLADQVRT